MTLLNIYDGAIAETVNSLKQLNFIDDVGQDPKNLCSIFLRNIFLQIQENKKKTFHEIFDVSSISNASLYKDFS